MDELGGSSINNSSALPYIPQVKNDVIPKIGQEFDTWDDAFNFYNSYAFESGFSVRTNSSRKNSAGEINRKEYVCSREGERAVNSGPIKRKRGITREGCKARMCVVLSRPTSKFVVTIFEPGHSHPLTTPKRVHLLPSHRKVSLAKRALIQQLGAANVPIHQQMSIFELQAGGLENVGCTQRDLYNAERDRRKSIEGHDANLLVEHFQLKKEKNPGFTFTVEVDDEGRMTHCFWADATARKSYQYFGDVVVFDTTYNTNRYSLIFAPILGVNHHGQTTLFGCGFLSDETTDSFEWLFKESLKAMPAGPPKMIITDQDSAMTKAFATVLPNTLHRYCIWHITMKFSEKIGAISYKEHHDELKKCIWDSESPEQFEAKWVEVVQKTTLSTNEWLQSMYNIRQRWIPAYTRHIFSAHMTSSQRAEISHAFFKRYVSPHNSLLDFVTRFERALSKLRHNELDLDHKDLNEKPQLKTAITMESQMSDAYTRTVFYKFQDQLFQSGAYVASKTHKDDERTLYKVERAKVTGSNARVVLVDKLSNYVSCSCKMFESDGIPCRHMLVYFTSKHFSDLPDEYILKRWTTTAKASRVMDDLGGGVREICDTSLLTRRNRVFKLACDVVEEAVLTEEASQLFEEALVSVRKKIAILHSSREGHERSIPVLGSQVDIPPGSQVGGVNGGQHSILEPFKVRAKGCGKRLKGGKEMAMKRTRRCTCCGLTGHDKRNCPKLQQMSSQDAMLNDATFNDDDHDIDDNNEILDSQDGEG